MMSDNQPDPNIHVHCISEVISTNSSKVQFCILFQRNSKEIVAHPKISGATTDYLERRLIERFRASCFGYFGYHCKGCPSETPFFTLLVLGASLNR